MRRAREVIHRWGNRSSRSDVAKIACANGTHECVPFEAPSGVDSLRDALRPVGGEIVV